MKFCEGMYCLTISQLLIMAVILLVLMNGNTYGTRHPDHKLTALCM